MKASSGDDYLQIQDGRRNLPIYSGRSQLIDTIHKEDTLIIIGETGSGKTTQVPQYIYESDLHGCKVIAVTQPRRVAATTLAARVSHEMNTTLGDLVGYSIRFEDVTSEHTRIKFLTDGMLLREAISDPLLLSYSFIILDEAHERTVNTDVLFGIVKKAQVRRKENRQKLLKIVIMSATMDVDHFSAYFNAARVVYVRGREHKVEIYHAKRPQEDYLFSCIITTSQIHRETPANEGILVFLTGQEEIESAAQQLRLILKEAPNADSITTQAKVYCLYSSLPSNLLQAAFKPPLAGMRKIIVATNLAETSLTIPGIKHVVDSGRVKTRIYHPGSGLATLKVQEVSKAQASQRAGRAGREGPGSCYRLHTKEEFAKLPEFSQPEILRCHLASVALQMLAIGIDISDFDFIDKPPRESIEIAMRQLRELGALRGEHGNSNGKLTELGERMARFPIDPCYSKMLLAAKDFGCSEEMLTLIALLSGDAIFNVPPSRRADAKEAHRKFASSCGDHVTLIQVYRHFNKAGLSSAWCHENFLVARNLQYAANVRKQLLAICKQLDIQLTSCGQHFEKVRKCLISGLFMNVAELHDNKQYVTIGTRQKVVLHPSSVLAGTFPPYVLFSELVCTSKPFLRHVSVVDPEWLTEIAPDYFKHHRLASEQTT